MAVTIDHGSKRRQMVELNLVPFIDFLSCMLAFLMMTATWAEISALEHQQNVGSGEEDFSGVIPPPPLTIHLTSSGYQIFRTPDQMVTLPGPSEDPQMRRLDQILSEQRMAWPDERLAVLNTDDGVQYGETMAVFDHLRMYGYSEPALAGGPPATR